MISYEWRTHLSADESAELADLLDRAARHDAEAEHNTIDFSAVAQAMAADAESVRHLVIWMLPHAVAMDRPDDPERIAGLVLLELRADSDGEANVSAVVDPDLRSIGIMTLLLEQVGVDTDEESGWLGSGAHTLRAWARGNHPAAGRISKRFLIPPNRRVWKLIRPIQTPPEAARATAAGRFTLGAQVNDSDEYGRYATIDEFVPAAPDDARSRRDLLDAAAAAAAASGLDAVAVNVDADDRAMVNACRLAGFQHDRTDVCYQIGGTP